MGDTLIARSHSDEAISIFSWKTQGSKDWDCFAQFIPSIEARNDLFNFNFFKNIWDMVLKTDFGEGYGEGATREEPD